GRIGGLTRAVRPHRAGCCRPTGAARRYRRWNDGDPGRRETRRERRGRRHLRAQIRGERGLMLRRLVAWSLSYRLLVLALTLVVGGLGTWAYLTLPVDAYPNIAQAQVKIILKAPGMTPEE